MILREKKTGQLKKMSAYYETAKIRELVEENYRVRSFVLDKGVAAEPGQFVMVWVPRFDEKPMCVVNDAPLTLSVANVGPFTQKLFELKQGDLLSFRGPLGNCFSLEGKGGKKFGKILLAGGGYGVAALNFLAKKARQEGIEVTMVVAARRKEDLILEKEFFDKGVKVFVSTDDGSAGFKGRAHELVEKLLAEEGEGNKGKEGRGYDGLYACGPEKMMEALAKTSKKHGLPSQLSLERYMGCGLGVCAKCDCGGKLVCAEGPVFSGEEALQLAEFGETHRDTMGHKHDW